MERLLLRTIMIEMILIVTLQWNMKVELETSSASVSEGSMPAIIATTAVA